MSCSAPLCGDDCCIPAGSNIANPLGFSGRHPCCAAPCVQFPPNNVQICLTINSRTQVKISQGCRIDGQGCDLYFPPSVAADSWGKRCRLVSWTRQVPTGAYIRIQLCPLDGCSDACDTPAYSTLSIPNSLSTFTVNGVSKLGDFLAARQDGGELDESCLVKAACIGAKSVSTTPVVGDTCCQWITAALAPNNVSWTSLGNLPAGTELIFGPIGL
jgi:hypothetical protein